MTARRFIAALAVLLALPLLGYLWPLPDAATPDRAEDTWTWPEASSADQIASAPSNLGTFWPGVKPTKGAGADGDAADSKQAGARHEWMLIGVINQGGSLSALVQDPQGNILALKPGDALDDTRTVSELKPTRLRWQDDEGNTGQLPLYPDPAPE